MAAQPIGSRSDPSSPAGSRWVLSRAGIINVYQYDNEVLHFGGGRLLLRGVNGSGKSTAMNMLLPFLITASFRRIDAAGEQTGVLKSWMLSGRDDPQPLGYLWIELVNGESTLVCGCGVKANRSTDGLRTWWFVTERRPGIDLALVERGVPLSDDALRAEIGAEHVFIHDRRADYRAEIRRRLFGGADLDQHLTLLNAVRNPRVGDRIDLELPDHLTAALPELSERAVSEAARPLDDLDEHRRNVASLTRTTTTLAALVEVYRSYLHHHLRAIVVRNRGQLRSVDELSAQVGALARQRDEAEAEEVAAGEEIRRLEADEVRLREEIVALKETPTYEQGRSMEDLAARVNDRARHRERLELQAAGFRDRLAGAAKQVTAAADRADRSMSELRATLDEVSRLRAASQVAAPVPALPADDRVEFAAPGHPVDPVGMGGEPPTLPAPAAPFVAAALHAAVTGVESAALVRRSEVDEVRTLIDALDQALAEVQQAERQRADRESDVARALSDLDATRASLSIATSAWDRNTAAWRTDLIALIDDPRPGPAAAITGVPPARYLPLELRARLDDDPSFADRADRAAWRDELAGIADRATTVAQREAARASTAVEEAEVVVERARDRLAALAAVNEPELATLPWQQRRGPCLADLLDFAPELPADQRASLEAGLEASGLLTAVVGPDGTTLADGDLVAVAAHPVANSLSAVLTVVIPAPASPTEPESAGLEAGSGGRAGAAPDAAAVAALLASISTDWSSAAPTVVTIDGRFRLGAARGLHAKPAAEYIGATARRATLERQRAEAAVALEEAEALRARAMARRAWCEDRQQAFETHRRALPALAPVDQALDRVEQATEELARRRERLAEAGLAVERAEAIFRDRSDQLGRTARTLSLPPDRAELAVIGEHLVELRTACAGARQQASVVEGVHDGWLQAIETWRQLAADQAELEGERQAAVEEHGRLLARLITIQDSLGASYHDMLASIAVSEADLDAVVTAVPAQRARKEQAARAAATAAAHHQSSVARHQEVEGRARDALALLVEALRVPGVIDTLTPPGAGPTAFEFVDTSHSGHRRLLDQVEARTPLAAGQPTTGDGLRISVRQRRDTLGSGWDAEARQPDERLPIEIRVEGPLGLMPLASALDTARDQLARLNALLTAKQDDALRNLLQGLVANEVAQKMDTADRLVRDMNLHLRKVTTAHGLGVELRWRRRAELSGVDGRMIELLAKLPDLRTEDETRELRRLVSDQLDEARALHPEVSYRELIATTLDYRRWHEMTVLTRWGDGAPQRLGRNNRFSEGEKKVVTYLPFLAAVAVSCDALAERAPDAPRFVLLDDAMAKVSEDNHADLLGLLVDLDLDFIATSERLWGTYPTVPELAITEVIRDAELGVILLDHYHWDGRTLTNRPAGAVGPGAGVGG